MTDGQNTSSDDEVILRILDTMLQPHARLEPKTKSIYEAFRAKIDTKRSSVPNVILLHGEKGVGKSECVDRVSGLWVEHFEKQRIVAGVQFVKSREMFTGEYPWMKSLARKDAILFIAENIDDLCRDTLKQPLSEASAPSKVDSINLSSSDSISDFDLLSGDLHSEVHAQLQLINAINDFEERCHAPTKSIIFTTSDISLVHPWVLSKMHLMIDASRAVRMGDCKNSRLYSGKSLINGMAFVRSSESRVPKVAWNDIFGLDRAKRILRDTIQSYFHSPASGVELSTTDSRHIILYGLPGTGKTMLAKAAASEIGASFFNLSLTNIIRPEIGVSEKNLSTLFRKAKDNGPAVIFIDEFESIFTNDDNFESRSSPSLVSLLLMEMDDIILHNHKVCLIAATNAPQRIPGRLYHRGRFTRRVHVHPPSFNETMMFIKQKQKERLTSAQMDEVLSHLDRQSLVRKMAHGYTGYTFVDVDALCRSVHSLSSFGDASCMQNQDDRNHDLTERSKHAVASAFAMTKPSYTFSELYALQTWESIHLK